MARREWQVLGIIFLIIMFILISLDFYNPFSNCVEMGVLTTTSVYCLFQSEMYDPFIVVFALLGFSFLIGSWFIPNK